MNEKKMISTATYHVPNLVSPKLAKELGEYRVRLAAIKAGYPVLTDWHPAIPEGWGEFAQVPFQRSEVYRGNADTWAYSHHQAITKFRDQYVVSWSNGLLHEDYVGQEVHVAWSSDGATWSEPQTVVATPPDSGMVRTNAGLYADEERLYCYVGVARDFGRDVAPPGMYSLTEQRVRLDVYWTDDLQNWQCRENICDNIYLVEGPRSTLDGRLMCCGFAMSDMHAIVLVWDGSSQPSEPPRLVHVPLSLEGVAAEEGTWYQTDDGRIWMFQRDNTSSCRLGLTVSDDGGETFGDLLLTDFPNSLSRAFAGRLTDGRHYIVGNNYDLLLDRRHLLIALSDDGYVFDRQYTLVEGDTTRRVNGRHKEDGYHYPNCLADGDRLLVAYSINKEDIEVGIADMSAVP